MFYCQSVNNSGGEIFISSGQLLQDAPIQPPGVTFTVRCALRLDNSPDVIVAIKNFHWIVPAPTTPPVAALGTIHNMNSHLLPQVGDVLSSSWGRIISGGPARVTYQWFSDSATITNETNPGYTIRSSDLGHTLSLVMTYDNGIAPNFVETATMTSAVVAAPTISSTFITSADSTLMSTNQLAGVGETLEAGYVLNEGFPAATISYQWYRDSGSGFVEIQGQHGRTYLITQADAGDTITVGVKATNTLGDTGFVMSSVNGRIYGFTYPANEDFFGHGLVIVMTSGMMTINPLLQIGTSGWANPIFRITGAHPLPNGVGIDPVRGTISGTPSSGTGDYSVQVTVTMEDTVLAAARVSRTLTIYVVDLLASA